MSQEAREKMQRNGIILAVFALAAIVLVMATQWATRDRIDAQQRNELLNTLNALIPPQQHDNDLYADCTLVTAPDALGSSQPQAVYRSRLAGVNNALALRTTAPDGYSGNIHLLVAVNAQGVVQGVRVLAHRETPGLGDKIELRRDDWILSFDGQVVRGDNDPRWAVRRDGGMFDAFTGATITPRAVVNAVERTVRYANQQRDVLFAAPANCQAQGDPA
ncbi:electron transport complex subunit RsxG [Aliidiomarina maris]|uniref:Ion-translocating oxidoreductase complex subunit G n=2 Tax=Aliidiomarina maris TaxID=531312 RepID=A0A327X4Z3_9GAMM|nr:electron transport complex subunit RsxG [Aliidiomarina maris]RAK01801.1 electron transport complex protein RnfG [Aliidiomarina maris]